MTAEEGLFHLVFVYGTLKEGEPNSKSMKDVER